MNCDFFQKVMVCNLSAMSALLHLVFMHTLQLLSVQHSAGAGVGGQGLRTALSAAHLL